MDPWLHMHMCVRACVCVCVWVCALRVDTVCATASVCVCVGVCDAYVCVCALRVDMPCVQHHSHPTTAPPRCPLDAHTHRATQLKAAASARTHTTQPVKM